MIHAHASQSLFSEPFLRSAGLALAFALLPLGPYYAQEPAGRTTDIHLSPAASLSPTIHPTLPPSIADMWLVPSESARTEAVRAPGVAGFVKGVNEFTAGNYSTALPLVSSSSLASSALAPVCHLLRGGDSPRALATRRGAATLPVAAGEADFRLSLGQGAHRRGRGGGGAGRLPCSRGDLPAARDTSNAHARSGEHAPGAKRRSGRRPRSRHQHAAARDVRVRADRSGTDR